MALYDGQGKLKRISTGTTTSISNTTVSDITVSLQIPSDIDENYKVKVFVWDSLQTMQPQNQIIQFEESDSDGTMM